MKIEKINENQIRCYLTSDDLAERKMKLSELAYGSEKARKLFKDMLNMAQEQYGFEGEDVPIMVEAIPTGPDALVLIITKVDNPDELDTRFSKFTPYNNEEENENSDEESPSEIFSENIIEQLAGTEAGKAIKNMIDNIGNHLEKKVKESQRAQEKQKVIPEKEYKSFVFDSLEQAASFAHVSHNSFHGVSQLYKSPSEGKYYLVLGLKNADPNQYKKVCNIACEFGEAAPDVKMSYYTEHFKCILKSDALSTLSVFM